MQNPRTPDSSSPLKTGQQQQTESGQATSVTRSSNHTRQRFYVYSKAPTIGFFPIGLVGLLLLLFIFLFGLTFFAQQWVEADVKKSVEQQLKHQGVGGITVNASGQEVLLTGSATQAQTERALAIAKAATGATWMGPLPAPTRVRAETTAPTNIAISPKPAAPIAAAKTLPAPTPTAKTSSAKWPNVQASIEDKHITLRGHINNLEDQNKLIRMIPSAMKLTNHLTQTEHPIKPEAFHLNRRVVAAITLCETGSASTQGGTFSVDCAVSKANKENLSRVSMAAMEVGRIGKVTLQTLGEFCQTQLNEVLANSIIQFAVNSAEIKQQSMTVLDQLAEAAQDCQYPLRVEGHTDVTGNPQANEHLSLARANAVVNALVLRGLDRSQLSAYGLGSTRPKVTGMSASAHAQNRRIEVHALLGETK